jgi:hypothetical protein
MENLSIGVGKSVESNIILTSQQTEMLKITQEGFWVRGVKVEQDEQEAQTVYQAFQAWLTWANLTRPY